MHWDAVACTGMQWDAVGCTGMQCDALGRTEMRVHCEGMGAPKSLGLGGRCGELSASAMDSDRSPWKGMGGPKSLGL